MKRRHFLAGTAAFTAAPALLSAIPTAFAQAPRIRRNVLTMQPTDPFFAKYGQAVVAMHHRVIGVRRHRA